MFRPNIQAQLHRRQVKRDVFGNLAYNVPVPVLVAIVKLGSTVEESPVRADSSASRASAEVTMLQAKLLVGPLVQLKMGDVIVVAGTKIEITGIHPRMNVLGKHDHNEVIGEIKAEL